MSSRVLIFVVLAVLTSFVGTSSDFSSGSLSVSQLKTRTSSRFNSSGSLPNAFEGEKCAKLKKKLACYKGCVVGNLFKYSLVMMHKNSSFPYWGRPEVRRKHNILLWCSVEHFCFTSWKKKKFRTNMRL